MYFPSYLPVNALTLTLIISCGHCQITQDANGAPSYSGTPVIHNPAGIPTLAYNCAKLPSICNNVNANGGNYALTPIGNAGNKGRLANVPYLELHVDPNSSRGDTRRGQSCPGNWKATHACPEPDQPLVVPEPFNRGGRSVSSGFVGSRLRPDIPQAAAGSYQIADPAGEDTGMAWTCDEFPPAFSIEGGRNPSTGKLASTYCAPGASNTCPDADRMSQYTRTEQDFQSSAHGRIQTQEVAAGTADYRNNIFTFRFQTVFQDTDTSYATRVDYYILDSQTNVGAVYGIDELTQRAASKTLMSIRHYSNGSVALMAKRVDISHGLLNGTQHVDAFDESNGGAAITRWLPEETHVSKVRRQAPACTPRDPPPYTDEPGPHPPLTTISSTFTTIPTATSSIPAGRPLETNGVARGVAVKAGTELRILPVGDSITVGFESGDGNGYRLQLQQDLSADRVVFAGTEHGGTMRDGYYGAWSGKTISYIASNIGPSLAQRPNIILLHAGTNDMNNNPSISAQGNDPNAAAQRLGNLIDQMVSACPDATILVAMIINTIQTASESSPGQEDRTKVYQSLIPGIVAARANAGSHVLTVDFADFPNSALNSGGVHLTDAGYDLMGDWWYDYIHQIPPAWIKAPIGGDPNRTADTTGDINANGGPSQSIPPPNFGKSPVVQGSKAGVFAAAASGDAGGLAACESQPSWYPTGKIALGLGHDGAWNYSKNWVQAGKVADGLHLPHQWVRLADMNGDGKADYLWINPDTGELTCWINNLPDAWTPAGTNTGAQRGIIASGAGVGASVFFADMNGDGKADYLVVNPDTGHVNVYWNYGPNPNWANGWQFVPGGQLASGVPHANWETLRFPDINGDGRADYVIIGEGGSLGMWLNTGSAGGQDVLFVAQGGIATGASPNISRLVFADIDGDGRDDYLVWDDEAGLTGFLNIRTQREGVPFFANQGPAKSVAGGITQPPEQIILADMDGDGKDDYCFIEPVAGAIYLWWNRGTADTSRASDGLRFADIDGDGLDDYVWLEHSTGAPYVYLNKGPDSNDALGWHWAPLNGGQPIAAGAGPAATVKFGDIDGDGMDDYLVLNPDTGALSAYLNGGPDASAANGYRFNPIGIIATGLGPGANVRIADIDGDGRDDYIFLHPNGGTTIYFNQFNSHTPKTEYVAAPLADASGIGQRPEEITFRDVDGDGKADYIWTRALDGTGYIWYNYYPQQPVWHEAGPVAQNVGASGANTFYVTLQETGRASQVVADPASGAIAAWLNGCPDTDPDPGEQIPPGGPKQRGVIEFVEDDTSVECGEDDCDEGGCVLNLDVPGCNAESDSYAGSCTSFLLNTVHVKACGSGSVWIHYSRAQNNPNAFTIDYLSPDGTHYWCQPNGADPDSGDGCSSLYYGTAPQAGVCSPRNDLYDRCFETGTGTQNDNTDLRNTMNANVQAGKGGAYYGPNVPIACTRATSSAGDTMCAYYTGGSEGGTLSAALGLINQIVDAGCSQCGNHHIGGDHYLTIDYAHPKPCNRNNGVTTCTCDTLGDGHCIA